MPDPTPEQVAAIAAKLTKAQRRNIRNTSVPQPLQGHWLWPGSVRQYAEIAELGIVDRLGFTPLGQAVRAHLLALANAELGA